MSGNLAKVVKSKENVQKGKKGQAICVVREI